MGSVASLQQKNTRGKTMKEPLVSVIVPVYKVEKYLDRCLNSIAKQTYKKLEIILVDDGSPDNCPKICDDWAQKDDRIKVVHKQNGGLSDARNAGLEVMTGDLIMFVDSDDYVDQNIIEKLLVLMEKTNADISCANYIKVDENYKFLEHKKRRGKICIYEGEKKFDCMLKHYVQSIVAWGKLYKKEIFDGIRFPFGKIFEDQFIAHKLIENANKFAYTNEVLYFYLQRPTSITGSELSIKSTYILDACSNRLKYFKDNDFAQKYIIFAIKNCFSIIFIKYFQWKNDEKIRKKLLYKFSVLEYKIKKCNQKIDIKTKIKIFMFKHCNFLLKIII
jgi:glycosyltransferase involved in cell wall biosynthesis